MKIHPSALVDPKARIARDVEIGPFCVVGPDVEIGPGCSLMQRVAITGRVRLGARNVFHPTVVIGGPPQDEQPAAPDAHIEIGDDNLFREAVTVNLPKVPGSLTKLGSRNRLLYGSHVAHDVQIGDDVTLEKLVLLGGHVWLADHVHLGELVVVHQFVTVSRYVKIHAHGGISEDALPFMEFEEIGNRPTGVNRGALEGDGFTKDFADSVAEAYLIIWRSGLPRPQAIARIELSPEPEVRAFADFLRRAAGGRMGRAREATRQR